MCKCIIVLYCHLDFLFFVTVVCTADSVFFKQNAKQILTTKQQEPETIIQTNECVIYSKAALMGKIICQQNIH